MSKNKFYPDEDINDLIEAEEDAFFKGGPGSGKKGHTTPEMKNYRKPRRVDPVQEAIDAREKRRSEIKAKLGAHEGYKTKTNKPKEEEKPQFHGGGYKTNTNKPLNKSYTEDINDLIEEELTKGRGPDKKPRKRRSDAGSGEGNFVYPKVSNKQMTDYVVEMYDEAHGNDSEYESDVMRAKLESMSESGLRSFYENTKDRVEN